MEHPWNIGFPVSLQGSQRVPSSARDDRGSLNLNLNERVRGCQLGWLKLDDKMPRNPKILAGDIETAWFYTCALTHAAEQLTDGFIARSAVPLIAPHITDPSSVADRCVSLGLFRQVEGGFEVPDFLDFNPSRASVLDRRAKDAERQASRRESQRDTAQTSGVSPPAPSRPVPDGSISSSTDGFKRANPEAVDDETSRQLVEDVATAVARHRLGKQTDVRNPNGWLKRCLTNMRTDDAGAWWSNLVRLCDEFPTAPVSMLAAAADGEMSPHLGMHRRAS